jgi:hypothetical protein
LDQGCERLKSPVQRQVSTRPGLAVDEFSSLCASFYKPGLETFGTLDAIDDMAFPSRAESIRKGIILTQLPTVRWVTSYNLAAAVALAAPVGDAVEKAYKVAGGALVAAIRASPFPLNNPA